MADAKPCPVCGKPGQTRFRPFCSARCAEVDLGRWFTGQYAVADREGEEERAPTDEQPD